MDPSKSESTSNFEDRGLIIIAYNKVVLQHIIKKIAQGIEKQRYKIKELASLTFAHKSSRDRHEKTIHDNDSLIPGNGWFYPKICNHEC